ncbi:MAG: DNA transformation protein tfoX [Nitrospinaceae bacterium]|nr:MAG: DNA transformation protein tfoX [Nitrospinaceae bacterium]
MEKESFKEFVLDQLHLLERVDCKAMFGGYGLYQAGAFFAIIADGRLYFKTGEATVSDYLDRDMKPFQPNSKQTLKNYYEVPAEILEDDEQLAMWARKAVAVTRQL